jgi:hypothetical protein
MKIVISESPRIHNMMKFHVVDRADQYLRRQYRLPIMGSYKLVMWLSTYTSLTLNWLLMAVYLTMD